MARGFPSVKCVATSRRTGNRCANWSLPGSPVCRMHRGKSPTAIAKAEMRMSVSQLLGEDRRPVGEVILDTVAIMDRLMLEAAVPLRAGEPLPADQLDRLLDATKLANHVAKVAVDAGATAALVRERERHRDQENAHVTGAVAAIVDGLEDHLVALGIDQRHVLALRTWAFEAAACKLEDREPPALPPVPRGIRRRRGRRSGRRLRAFVVRPRRRRPARRARGPASRWSARMAAGAGRRSARIRSGTGTVHTGLIT